MANLLGAVTIIFVLTGCGYLSRRIGVFRAGDERVLNSFVYYFSLPAFLVVELSSLAFSWQLGRFALAGVAPLFLAVLLLALLRFFRISKEQFYLFAVSTVFGNLVAFGIPFVEYAIGGAEVTRLGALAVGVLVAFGVGLALTLLELYQAREAHWREAAKRTALGLARNPLVIAIVLGGILGAAKVELPRFIVQILRYLSAAVVPLALFSLGVFLYGRPYRALPTALGLALLRLVFLPSLTLALAWGLGLPGEEVTVLVVMNGTPLAVNLTVLAQRYGFFMEEMASLTLLSSLGSLFTLSLWRFVLTIIAS